MNGNIQEQKPNHKASEQARREVIGLVERDTNHRLLQATERPHVHPRAWLEDWCKACAFTHHIPALMQLVIFLERVYSSGRLELETR